MDRKREEDKEMKKRGKREENERELGRERKRKEDKEMKKR